MPEVFHISYWNFDTVFDPAWVGGQTAYQYKFEEVGEVSPIPAEDVWQHERHDAIINIDMDDGDGFSLLRIDGEWIYADSSLDRLYTVDKQLGENILKAARTYRP